MKERINRVLFDNGADFKDIDSVYLIKFCEEKLKNLSFEIDEYYSIYKEVKKICRFTIRFKIKNIDCIETIKKMSTRMGIDVGRGVYRTVTDLSFASGTSLVHSVQILGRAMVSAGVSARMAATAMAGLNSAIINNRGKAWRS